MREQIITGIFSILGMLILGYVCFDITRAWNEGIWIIWRILFIFIFSGFGLGFGMGVGFIVSLILDKLFKK